MSPTRAVLCARREPGSHTHDRHRSNRHHPGPGGGPEDPPTPALKQQWRALFGAEPPPYNRKFLESRLAYRIQELAYGGLKPETMERLAALGKQLDGGNAAIRKKRVDTRPIAGTRLIREWQGIEHCATVLADGYEYQGRPYKILSAVPRAITGTRWNGWVFFGLKNQGAGRESARIRSRSSASCAAPSTPASRARKGSIRSSTRSMRSAKRARPMSPASGPKAGCWCRTATTTGASQGRLCQNTQTQPAAAGTATRISPLASIVPGRRHSSRGAC